MSSEKPLLQSVPLTNLTSSSNLVSEHIINARCVRVLIRFIFCFFEENESQRMYKPVKVDLRYTVVRNAEVSLHTNTSRKGRAELFSFSRVNHVIQMWEKFASLGFIPKNTKSVVDIMKVHFRCLAFGEQINLMETHENASHSGTHSWAHRNSIHLSIHDIIKTKFYRCSCEFHQFHKHDLWNIRWGQITPVQHICTYINSFQYGNTSEETTDIKRIHAFVQWRTPLNESSKFERIFYTICIIMYKHWLQYPIKPLDNIGLSGTPSLWVLGNP